MTKHSITADSVVTLRPATADDARALARLAQLDSAQVPAGDVLLAVVDGTPLAAMSLDTGHVVADPFARTLELVRMLHERAARITHATTIHGAVRRGRSTGASPRWQALLHR